MLRPVLAALALTLAPRLAGAPDLIPAAESLAPPTPARLDALAAAGARDGWAPVRTAAAAAALRAYGQDRLNAAETWHQVQGWAALFGETEAEFIPPWIKAIEDAKVAHANMSRRYKTRERPMGEDLSPALKRWLLGNAAFSSEFFSLLTPVDFLPQVFVLLNELHASDPARFREYASLALALAVVYDVPPPPDWPHAQVSAALLPRRWPSATRAFSWWVDEDRAGRTYHRLALLDADELKFVIDAAAPFDELSWSQRAVGFPLADFAQTYGMVRYRTDRVQANVLTWPGRSYQLWDILQAGGICIDQAYFSVQSGKARGMPTLLFIGSGLDGRHAWFGFLDDTQTWQLDAGRYAEQRLVTGVALDPQTWRLLSDHELQFLTERFRALPSYRQSRIHALFADELRLAGRVAEAAAAARKAVNYERRNLAAWETLLAVQQQQRAKPVVLEATLREAATAFQRHPDLEISFDHRLVASLRARGETSQADFEEHNLARKFQATRSDLSIRQAGEILRRSFDADPVPVQIRTYNTVLENLGRGAGIDFFDKIVTVFAEHLQQLNQPAEAAQAVERARQVLQVEPGKQLEREIEKLLQRIQRGR